MLVTLVALALPAAAGDQALYERAIRLIDDRYLRAERISHPAMLVSAADQLEARLDWLLADGEGGTVHLRDGHGGWEATVTLEGDADLPAALSRLEDAVRPVHPVPEGVDLRAEILRGAVRTLDRHSAVLYADGLERFDERLSGTLSGIGATIGRDGDAIVVRDLASGAPAERAGLQAGDRILTIDGVSTVGMLPSDATHRIRGTVGTDVVLRVRRGEADLTITCTRDEVPIRNVESRAGPDGVGVIAIDTFSEQTRGYLAEALADLRAKGLLDHGLIVDLRGNTGGSLTQSAQAVDAFVQAGLIVRTVGRNGEAVPGLVPRFEAHGDAPGLSLPIAVLMDHATASGSEILAGALARLGRAVLVGTTSFGKGTVQKLYPLEPALKLKLTVAEYLLDGDYRVADVGLAPDVALEDVRFTEDGIWYPSPARRDARAPAIPVLVHADEGDRALEVAARLVVAAGTGGGRPELLQAASTLAGDLATEDEHRLSDAFRKRGIDWSAAPEPPAAPWVSVEWGPAEPTAGQTHTLTVTVTNHGGDLHRVAVRLDSVNPDWDDRVLPIGFLPAGGTGTGTVQVGVGSTVPTRTDRVGVTLEADGAAPTRLAPHDIRTVGAEAPAVQLVARAHRLDGEGNVGVRLRLRNPTDHVLSGVVARVAFPEVDGIELVRPTTDPVSLDGRRSADAELRLHLGPSWSGDALPLRLEVTGAGVPQLADWPLDLPLAGRPVRLAAPVLSVEPPPTVLPVGTTSLQVRAVDDGPLDHLVVYGGVETMNRARALPTVEHTRAKLAWSPGHGRSAALTVDVPVAPGANHYVVVAEDAEGIRTERDVYVYGEGS